MNFVDRLRLELADAETEQRIAQGRLANAAHEFVVAENGFVKAARRVNDVRQTIAEQEADA